MIPTKRLQRSQSQTIATVYNLFHDLPLEAELVSTLTDQVTKCEVTERGNGEYEISHHPTLGGAHQLHVRVGEKEVRGSPFSVAVKTPVDKLGTVIKTINGLQCSFNGVTVNKSGDVIVPEDSGVVSVYSANGIKSCLSEDTFEDIHGVAVDNEGNVFVACVSGLVKVSPEGAVLSCALCDRHGYACQVCVNSVNGKVYVTGGNEDDCVRIFNSDLTYSSKFGSMGSGVGQFNQPWGVASDSSGSVYVADTGNCRIQVFTPEGHFLRQFRRDGNRLEQMSTINGICVDSDDLVYVGEAMNGRVSVFTTDGKFIKCFGTSGSKPGQFCLPQVSAVGPNGVVYVLDIGNKRVQLF